MSTDTSPETADAPAQSKPPWLSMLDDEIPELSTPGEQSENLDFILGTMIKEYLLSDDDDAPAAFARRFDDLYDAVYVPKFNGYRREKKGWTGYLAALYQILLPVVMEMFYDDPKQDKVIQLLSELRKLPPRAVKVFLHFEWVDCEIWCGDPIFPWQLLAMAPSEEPAIESYHLDKPGVAEDFEQETTRWVSAAAFHARCTAAGFDVGIEHRFTHAGEIIAIGLQPGYLGPKTKLDCHIMAAAQWILHAGDVIDDECVRNRRSPPRQHSWKGFDNGNGPVVWKQWGDELAKILAALETGGDPGFKLFEKNREALTNMVVKARDKMLALEPGLFVEPGPEPVADGTQSVSV